MTPRRIEGATRYLGAPKGWEPESDGTCSHLAIQDQQYGEGNMMVSSWEPTPAEIELLQTGAPVRLAVYGVDHPPVFIWVPTPKES